MLTYKTLVRQRSLTFSDFCNGLICLPYLKWDIHLWLFLLSIVHKTSMWNYSRQKACIHSNSTVFESLYVNVFSISSFIYDWFLVFLVFNWNSWLQVIKMFLLNYMLKHFYLNLWKINQNSNVNATFSETITCSEGQVNHLHLIFLTILISLKKKTANFVNNIQVRFLH